MQHRYGILVEMYWVIPC